MASYQKKKNKEIKRSNSQKVLGHNFLTKKLLLNSIFIDQDYSKFTVRLDNVEYCKCLQLMFSSVSHEFRTPLNAFSNSLTLLEINWSSLMNILQKDRAYRRIISETDKQNQKYFKIGKVSSTILLSLIEDILDLAKLEVGTFSLNEESFLVRKLLEEIDYIFAFQCSQKKLNFKIEADCDVCNATFISDHRRIKQILMNLISNSFKFTNIGGITLKVRSRQRLGKSAFRLL